MYRMFINYIFIIIFISVMIFYIYMIYRRTIWDRDLTNIKEGSTLRKNIYADKVLGEENTVNLTEPDKIKNAIDKLKKNIAIFQITSIIVLLILIVVFFLNKESSFDFFKYKFNFNMGKNIEKTKKTKKIKKNKEDKTKKNNKNIVYDDSIFYNNYDNLYKIAHEESKTNTRYNAREGKNLIKHLEKNKNKLKDNFNEYIENDDYIVIIDPGHGGVDPGTLREDHYEKNINLDISLKLKYFLENNKINVVLTREEDETLELYDRIKHLLYYRKTIYISIHINSWKTREVQGYDIFYYSGKIEKFKYEESKKLGEFFYEHLKKQDLIKPRTVKDSNFNIVKYSNSISPALLIELGFITNDNDFEILTNNKKQDKIAEALGNTIIKYLSTVNKGE
ncbi:MAG: N-acetylmuramoyl-L-alanine amidase [Fusobacteria bacterium]|nr:N-acetylmuramoyl-L-alanine amidase [Fusobacteriota bacterium]